jgi:hypothetical protein
MMHCKGTSTRRRYRPLALRAVFCSRYVLQHRGCSFPPVQWYGYQLKCINLTAAIDQDICHMPCTIVETGA